MSEKPKTPGEAAQQEYIRQEFLPEHQHSTFGPHEADWELIAQAATQFWVSERLKVTEDAAERIKNPNNYSSEKP